MRQSPGGHELTGEGEVHPVDADDEQTRPVGAVLLRGQGKSPSVANSGFVPEAPEA